MIGQHQTAGNAERPNERSMVEPTTRGARILVVDDDRQILRVIRSNLVAHGYEALEAASGEEALDVFVRHHPDLVILDLGLPGIDGLTVIERMRAHSQTPIVVLSAREGEPDKVRALDLGADDYLTKPFGLDELLARVRVALRHAAHPAHGTAAVVRGNDLEVDVDRRRVVVRGQEVHLSPTEYELLKLFVTNSDRVLTHHWLLQRVWGPQYGSEGNYLHVYVAGLRKKLEENPKRPRHLLTEPGVGYRFHLDPTDGS
jgi:two-component system KDP operon response regulator KdpE